MLIFNLLRGSAIGSTPAFGAGYPGSSPGPGAKSSFSQSLTNLFSAFVLGKRTVIQVSCNRSLDRDLFSIHSLNCSLHRFTGLFDHTELIPAPCLGAGACRGGRSRRPPANRFGRRRESETAESPGSRRDRAVGSGSGCHPLTTRGDRRRLAATLFRVPACAPA